MSEDEPAPVDTDLEEESAADDPMPPVIGIGASAGGVDALLRLIPTLSADPGMAFVVVQHLDPHHASALAAVLRRTSPLPVSVIEDGMAVKENHIYVIPQNARLTIAEGRLHLVAHHGARMPEGLIDGFFVSLARDRGESAGCVILSGTGSDGTLGLRAIKENGGLTVAQADASYDGMMRSAVATGMVDFTLTAEQIGAKLTEYFGLAREMRRHRRRRAVADETASRLPAIIALLRSRTGNDFSGYKDRTIIRRVQRRMHVLHITDADSFVERLRNDPHEVTLLFQDLLIGVTEFFRDGEAFASLKEKVVPELFRDKTQDHSVRVWIPGCSTGEEAYSIAILLREYASALPHAPRLQIFASDIDEQALEVARIGRYPASIARDMPTEYLARYFVREDGTYRIAGDLREICLFSVHNLLRDAPFSRQDLISCRNLLIYLNSDLQSHVIPLFHYALNPNGFLFLGTSENVTRHSRLFATVDKTHRIFQRRAVADRRLPEFPLSAPDASRRSGPARVPRTPGNPSLRSAAERQLLDRFLPAYVVINAEGDLLQASGRTGKYLELPAGVPDTNLFSMARPGLRVELRAALHRAITSGQAVTQPKVAVDTDGGRQEIDLYVQPLRFGSPPETFYMIVFQDVGAVQPGGGLLPTDGDHDLAGISVRQLETELRATRERLQTTSEELESSNEELKSSNEELSSMNEELQSANEELETSKEELQSINEELHTVNAELNARVDELTRASNDMSNLLDSTQIATIFLDRQLLVKGFTPAAKDVFHLVESDTGRPIMHVRPRVEIGNLQQDAERVLRTLGTIERQAKSIESDTLFIMRLLPYRTTENVISGIVMTFIDVTRVAAAEARVKELTSDLRARIQELETVIDLVPAGVMIAEGARPDRVLVNQYGAYLLGYAEGHRGLTPVSADFATLQGTIALPEAEMPLRHVLTTGEAVSAIEGKLQRRDGGTIDIMVSATPLFDDHGAVRGAIAALVDVSPLKASEARQRVLLDELQHRVKNTLATVSSLATRMARRSRSLGQFRESFLSRLAAMGRTHDLLSGGAWTGASLRALLLVALDSYANPEKTNIALIGEDVRLTPNTASTLGMVFHELATNAAKYGALSTEGGVVEVSWTVRQDAGGGQQLHIGWVERNGPPVDASAAEGFGTGFVRRSVEYEMEGRATVQLLPEGLHCDIEFPLVGNVE
ncbi:MAG TPA: CheR family methyltransferase [Rhodopila sp.]|nr:CheR family methyltransferase [Rhodopila sp.]